MKHIKNPFIAATNWTVLGDDTTNFAASAICLTKAGGTTGSLEFDKANGTANTTYAGVYSAPSASVFPEIWDRPFCGAGKETVIYDVWDRIGITFYVSATTAVAGGFIRMGLSASHYLEWRCTDTTAGWNTVISKIGDCFLTGNGMTLEDRVTYFAVGVKFDAETDALADIKVDNIFFVKQSELSLS